MASSLPETFGERPQKESQSGSGARVDPPGLEFVRAVKELLEMGAAVMENPMVSEFITSTYQGLISLADDSYPGNDIEWHESLGQQGEHDPDEDDAEELDSDEDDSDGFEDEDTEPSDAQDDDDTSDDDDDYDDESDRPRKGPKQKPFTEDEEEPSDEDLGDDEASADDEPQEEADGDDEDDDDDEDERPKSRKMMAKLVTSLKGLSNEFQRFNAEFRRMKGKVD